ncbi:helix-turn-helix transcriptional regulator [Fulvivirgaceae bacterium BMA10]|uniref:Helix-turn-helix transcriptional regulator n=1 Tax=Splendidivirga corallicola TaxID=3051826 RepID=A0ABT8KGD7_9BACT|nr:helix-turn-helix transcriptional regulator [Fulvivirgaceae bacterium BMA10]
MKGTNLGEFEELIMLVAGVLYPEAYGVAIKKEIYTQTGRKVTLSAVHSALHRLEKKGFLESKFGDATKIRGGKRKKFFIITTYGSKVLNEAMSIRKQLWDSIPKVALGG